ncbi:CDP-alcohol phosphatidyltransferase family protein [uncultured Endozoicomonas sp.]|uniref:CDP-alcohol phosphatidyltransferase family protein n=1 Tax=uncultured Endozoicomonas sp. TaxID=432652 RepID=UPI0026313EA5|nr:CDP-alcohol phosphatidyltransferase family protein [uncultured Endozoicomonas sp.]
MFDKWTAPLVQIPLKQIALKADTFGITPNQVTVAGFCMGMLAIPLLAMNAYSLALIAIVINRILDGLDGALARLNQPTDAGGFLDITLDFIFYSGIVVGFALADPTNNALAASVLIFSFMGTGSSFLAFAIMAEKHQLTEPHFKHKSLYYLGGLAEGTETILLFVLFCLFPHYFSILAYSFAAICFLTTFLRIIGGYKSISLAENE